MIELGNIKDILLILGGITVFLFILYIFLSLTSKKKTQKPTQTTTQIPTQTTTTQIPKCVNDTNCVGNKLCLNGECVCYPMFTGIDCNEPIFPNDALQNFSIQLNKEDISVQNIDNIFNQINKYIPGNYKNKEDLLNVISNLQILNNNNNDKNTKLKAIRNINNFINCENPKIKCNDNCLELGTDFNCSSCGDDCTKNGTICSSGKCRCPQNTVWYSANGKDYSCVDNSNGQYIECDGVFYDSKNNKEKCGSCTNKCPDTQECKDGKCSCPQNTVWYSFNGIYYSCVDNSNKQYIECDGVIYDSKNNTEKCGSCDKKCRYDQRCVNGTCVCGNYSQTECNNSCVDYSLDPNNCGGCNKKIPENTLCVNGLPVGLSGYKYCGNWNDQTGKVVNISSDTTNCGDCNHICMDPNSICKNGACDCIDGYSRCSNGTCVKIGNNDNCGFCGDKCSIGQNCFKNGVSGNYVCGCQSGVLHDDNNCTMCGDKCMNGTNCIKDSQTGIYKCVCKSGTLNDDNNCGSCGQKVPNNTKCDSTNPYNMISGIDRFHTYCGIWPPPNSTYDINKYVVNLITDINNCGQCGNICPPGKKCLDGFCQ